MTRAPFDALIIGGGPGGYRAALDCAAHGLRAALVERQHLGGTCLNVGCIPSKALIHVADRYAGLADPALATLGVGIDERSIDLATSGEWMNGVVTRLRTGVGSLLDGAGVSVIQGVATIVDGKTVDVITAEGPVRLRTANLVLATGSCPVELPNLPFGGSVISSTEALALSQVPATLTVVGAGFIGLEIGTAYAKLGSKVTVVEATERILPQYSEKLTRPVLKQLKWLGVEVMLGWSAYSFEESRCRLIVRDRAGDEHELASEKVLVAVGRAPMTNGFGLERLDLKMIGSSVWTDERCETSMSGVYAIGDVTGEPMLAHRATAQAAVVADVIAGQRRRFDIRAMPSVCFTDPEIFSVGLTAEDAERDGVTIAEGIVPFRANGRALTLQQDDGFITIVAARDDHRVLGVHGVGCGVSELTAAGSLAIEMGATLEDIRLTVHVHPSLTEMIEEAAARALGACHDTLHLA
jgi:dihydrolipoamide dehydrogenase